MMHVYNGFSQTISGNKHGKIMFGCFDETTLLLLLLPLLVPLLRVHQRIVRDEFMKGARSEQYAPSLQVVSILAAKGVKPSVLLKRCVAKSMVLCGPWPLSSKWNVGTQSICTSNPGKPSCTNTHELTNFGVQASEANT